MLKDAFMMLSNWKFYSGSDFGCLNLIKFGLSQHFTDTKKHTCTYNNQTPHQFSFCWNHLSHFNVLQLGLEHISVLKRTTGVHVCGWRQGLHWDFCQTLLLPSCGFNKDRIRPQWVNELRCKAEESIRSALKANGEDYWANRKVSALNKTSGIRNTNGLFWDLTNFNFHLYPSPI